jgi:glycosyltransferase involved in cell wall biosynthesis
LHGQKKRPSRTERRVNTSASVPGSITGSVRIESASSEQPGPLPRKRLRLISNVSGLGQVTRPDIALDFRPWPRGRRLWHPLNVFFRSFRYDYILLNGSPRDLLVLALLKLVFPFNRCRIVALDILLSQPCSLVDRIKTVVRSALLQRVDRIILYYKDTAAIQQHFRLPAGKFAYVPFKINRIDLVSRTAPTDQGYVFCGGKTRRDFETLIDAVAPLSCPVKIVTTPNPDIARHGSHLEDGPLPPHVEVVRLDGSAEPFIELMAGARLVVLPIKPDITGVGIGVYIMAMALGKPVVITAGPSTEGLLSEDLAVVVPPRDVAALRRAIDNTYNDAALRRRLGENGLRYAAALGGEERLNESLLSWLVEDLERRRPGVDPVTTRSRRDRLVE